MCRLSRSLAVAAAVALLASAIAAAAQTPNPNAAPGAPSGVKSACDHDIPVRLGADPAHDRSVLSDAEGHLLGRGRDVSLLHKDEGLQERAFAEHVDALQRDDRSVDH